MFAHRTRAVLLVESNQTSQSKKGIQRRYLHEQLAKLSIETEMAMHQINGNEDEPLNSDGYVIL